MAKSFKKLLVTSLVMIIAFAVFVSMVFMFSCATIDNSGTGNTGEYTTPDDGSSGGSDTSGGNTDNSSNTNSGTNGGNTNNGGNTSSGNTNNGGNTSSGNTNNGGNTSSGNNNSGTNSGSTGTNGTTGNNGTTGTNGTNGSTGTTTVTNAYTNAYASTTKVGYSAVYLGEVARNIPTETKDEGLAQYPTYGTTLSLSKEDREALISENSYISAKPTKYTNGTYDAMDKDGYLYLNGEAVLDADGNQRQLYKHTASVGMYYGDVSDEEPGIIKQVTLAPRGYGSYSVTGVYAPAGEVITIRISQADMKATGGITIYIGQVMYSSYPNNIGSGVNPNRMSIVENTMEVNTRTATLGDDGYYTAYVGSYLGGPIYIGETSQTVTVTISGGVRYSHFIMGYTTQEEFEQNAASSAPYFDLEIREYGILHSGPKKYVQSYSYEDIYDAAVLWEKVTLISTQGVNQGIALIYDTYIVNGYYAVSFVGWRTTILPGGTMSSALNAKSFTNSGAWAVIHEYNHHFQHYGAGFTSASDEVTNNGLNLVEYSMYTTISGNRGISNYGAENLADWSRYLSATWSLKQVLNGNLVYTTSSGLPLYSTILNNLGQDNYMQAKVVQQATSAYTVGFEGYLGALTEVTHYNMSYFFNTLLNANVDEEFINTYTDENYPMFVPISSVYQTGRSILYDGETKYIETMRPYKISYGQDFTVDMGKYTLDSSNIYQSGSVVLPDGFSYTVKSITQPESGKITKVSDYVYTYTPGSALRSGKIYVTLAITKDDGAFTVEDVQLVLEFEQSHEVTKNVTERTVYSYTENFYDSTAGKLTTTAADIYEKNFAGYTSVTNGNNSNPLRSNGTVIQDCNTDVWFVDKLQDDSTNTTDGIAEDGVQTQVIVESGKLYATTKGKYRIAVRGRKSVALYISLDGGETYTKAAEYYNTSNSADFPNTEGTYVDVELEANSWVYYKEILIRYSGEDRNAFMGLGWGKWTEEEGEVTYDSDGNPIYGDDYVAASVSVTYATAYRTSYKSIPAEEFTSEYLYTRNYSYTYQGITTYKVSQEGISEGTQFSEGWGHKLEYLYDGDNSTYMHTSYEPSESHKLVLVAKLGETITANRLIFDGSHNSEQYFLPKAFVIWVSTDGVEWTQVSEETESAMSSDGWQVVANFDELRTFSYYKIEITATHKQYVALRSITFQKYDIELEGGTQYSPDNSMFTYIDKDGWTTKSVYSTFGHVYVGKKDATLEFTFTGTRFGVLSTKDLGTNFTVEIDGKKATSIDLVANSGVGASFISNLLKSGTHTVKITCTGEANIDSIVTW